MIIESIQKEKHQRLRFSCGAESLDRFLHESAHQAASKGLSKTYVAVDVRDETEILGYYTLTTTQIETGEMPESILRALGLPKKNRLPASLVGRLAVSLQHQKQRVGSLMLLDAMARCARVANEIGGVAIVVDALDESVVAWYERFQFSRFGPTSLKMFIPMATVRKLPAIAQQRREAG